MGATPLCSGGACVAQCGGGLDECGTGCVDTASDPLHCGGCNQACNADEVCVQGNCEQYDTAVGCTACPCAQCGGNDTCCPYPGDAAYLICVNGGNGCPL
jgi:hypothetical protein